MSDSTPLLPILRNQDLLRGAVHSLDAETIAAAMRWLRGTGDFPKPTSIHLNLTLRCTARCVHCMQWTWPDQPDLAVSDVTRLLSIFSAWGVKTITVGGGNPLLHPEIISVLDLAKQAHIQVGIITEGLDMADDLVVAVCRDAEWIRFSLDGPDPETHDAIRNTPGLFRLVAGNVGQLKSRDAAFRVGLNCVVQKGNIEAIPRMIDLADQLGVDTLTFKLPHGDDRSHRYLPSLAEWRTFVKWVRSVPDGSGLRTQTNLAELRALLDTIFLEEGDVVAGRPVRTFYSTEQIHCFAPLFFLTCDSSGNMYPCDYLQADTRLWGEHYGTMRNEFSLGNVLTDSDAVLNKLSDLMRQRVHGLPASGYDECGCCTRFCQLNTSLTKLDRALAMSSPDGDMVKDLVQLGKPRLSSSQFL